MNQMSYEHLSPCVRKQIMHVASLSWRHQDREGHETELLPALRLRKVTTQGLSPFHFQLEFPLQPQIFFTYVLLLINIPLHFFSI